MRYFFRVEYDGSGYGGWQRQPNARSIQEMVENALSTVLRSPVAVTGAGRTDAGVHALALGVHFDHQGIDDLGRFEQSINGLLPYDIAIFNLQCVEDSFHARFSANSRRYRYYFISRKHPLYNKRAWVVNYSIDWEKVRQNMNALEGTRDFAVFCASGSGAGHTICTVKEVSLESENDFVVFTIEANRFIYKMVRSIVGTLIDIGRGKLNLTMDEIIASRDRKLAGTTAPPYGLVLENVTYTESKL